MKPGSIVECVKVLSPICESGHDLKTPLPIKGNYYEVDGFENDYLLLVGFTKVFGGMRIQFAAHCFREIEFPPSLELEISESLNRQLQEV